MQKVHQMSVGGESNLSLIDNKLDVWDFMNEEGIDHLVSTGKGDGMRGIVIQHPNLAYFDSCRRMDIY